MEALLLLAMLAAPAGAVYLGEPIGSIPACTPLHLLEYGRPGREGYQARYAGDPKGPSPTILRDLNDRWNRINLDVNRYSNIPQFRSLTRCIESVDSYAGRYTSEHLGLMERGELIAGMPAEFAFMTLGKPDFAHRPTVVSTLNPVTGKAETFYSHTWTDLGKRGMWASVFGVVTVAALGVSGVSSSIGTQVDALNVAAASSITSAALTTSAIAHASVVSVEIDTNKQIRTITLGGL